MIKLYNFAVISIKCTSNNTLITAMNFKGSVIFSCSNGFLGIKGSKRSSLYASQNLGYFVGKKLHFLGFKYTYVKLKGLGFGRFTCLKGIYYSGLRILYISDTTKFAYNGCKKPKARRL